MGADEFVELVRRQVQVRPVGVLAENSGECLVPRSDNTTAHGEAYLGTITVWLRATASSTRGNPCCAAVEVM